MNATFNPSTRHDHVVEPFTIAYQQQRITQMLDPPGLRIEGELDVATLPALTLALSAITSDSDICLDLAALTFIDVGSLRVLVATAARLEDGHVLTLRAASPQVRRMLELTGWHGVPQLRLQNGPLPAVTVGLLRRLGEMLGLRRPPAPA